MSIFSLDLNTFKQDFSILNNNKEMYGEVHTDFKLINDMFKTLSVCFAIEKSLNKKGYVNVKYIKV